jgi:RNA polymerase sigma-70 factor (ECF subfamily)
MVPPDQQDVALWRRDIIEEGARLLDRAANLRRTGPRQVMATIHAAHLSRAEGRPTPWRDIAALYDVLLQMRPGVVTAVNRAVAVGEAIGADAGLQALMEAEAPPDWLPYQAARAGLCAKAGRTAEAAAALKAALALDPAPAERLFLKRRLAALQ